MTKIIHGMNTTDDNLIKPIESNQNGIHENLMETVRKHQNSLFQRPIADHTRQAFDAIASQAEQCGRPLILDSGCGTAVSTRHIARLYPDAFVIGVDRSEARLGKQYEDALPENAVTVRADLVDFWRLAEDASWKLQRHFILYPNPYPKSMHLKRRWHGHPVFSTLLALGGELELRTNWRIYAEEFAEALRLSGYTDANATPFTPDEFWTLFEKKYDEAGQALYRVRLALQKRQG